MHSGCPFPVVPGEVPEGSCRGRPGLLSWWEFGQGGPWEPCVDLGHVTCTSYPSTGCFLGPPRATAREYYSLALMGGQGAVGMGLALYHE